MTAEEYLKTKVINFDSLNESITSTVYSLTQLMEDYHEMKLKKLRVGDVSISLTPEIAEKLLMIRDSIVAKDYNEAWHYLYSIASPNHDKKEPWWDLEKLAGRL